MASRRLTLFLSIANSAILIAGIGLVSLLLAKDVSNYPLAIHWSESGRIFEASLVYAPIIYGRFLPWPWLDPGRAILEGVVFLLPGGQIWLYRLWVSLLQFGMTALAAALAFRRVRSASQTHSGKIVPFLIVLWGVLFLFQSPIYPHVLLGAVLVLWLADPKKPVRILVVVLLASVWEGLCRVNWFLVPAILVVLIYLLTTPIAGKKLLHYLLWPALWLLMGAVASVSTYGLYIGLTHWPIPFLDPEMNYAFFRFKLWPNDAFFLGLLPGIGLVILPGLVFILAGGGKKIRRLHWFRWLVLLGILGAFFLGSTVVSMRAGGGFDLHNYDTFNLLFFVVCLYWGMAAVASELPGVDLPKPSFANPAVLLGMTLVPFFFALIALPNPASLSERDGQVAIARIQSLVQAVNTDDRPVLLIEARHLFAYGLLPETELFLPYEKIELMEMAMAGNSSYLAQFWQDVAHQRFSLIVTDVLWWLTKDVNEPFGYENNVWVENVAEPIHRFYERIYYNPAAGLEIYAPLTEPSTP